MTTSIEIGPSRWRSEAVIHYAERRAIPPPRQHRRATRLSRLQLISLDRWSGEVLWTTTLREGPPYDDRHRRNTYASGTPVTDGRLHVWAFFESEGMYCLDFEGNIVWQKDIGDIAKAGMGPGTSPVLFENLVILQCDQQGNGVSTDP